MINNKKSLILLFTALILLVLGVVLLIPASRAAVFQAAGWAEPAPVYNGFEPFMPLIPGYFPEDFSITHVHHGAHTSQNINTYSETYASDTHFFITIQRQGPAVESFTPQDGITFQEQPGRITGSSLREISEHTDLALEAFDTSELWMATVVLRKIQIQAVTNLPQEEIVLFTESLVPAICTEKPTPEPSP